MSNQKNLSAPVSQFRIKQTVFQLALAGVMAQPLALQAQIIPDQNSAYKPEVTKTLYSVPVVNITAPTEKGVSRNQYEQFNISRPQAGSDSIGVILNNSQTETQWGPDFMAVLYDKKTDTEIAYLGGRVLGNDNLKNSGPARVIVNEVTGTQPSSLSGDIAVAGQKADVVLSNPNGITVNGAGFINTSRAVLTTGTPVFGGSGSLDGFRVTQGQIEVNRGRLEGSNQLDLIAQSVKINGLVESSGTLNIIAGNNTLSYANLSPSNMSASGSEGTQSTPPVAIDVGQLGGMYANKINLLSTEKGAGVNIQGSVEAPESVDINSAGKLTLKDAFIHSTRSAFTYSSDGSMYRDRISGQINLTAAENIDVSGTRIRGNAALDAGDSLNLDQVNTGWTDALSAKAKNDLNVSDATLKTDDSLMISAGRNLNVSRSNLNVFDGSKMKLQASQDIDVKRSEISAYNDQPVELITENGRIQIQELVKKPMRGYPGFSNSTFDMTEVTGDGVKKVALQYGYPSPWEFRLQTVTVTRLDGSTAVITPTGL